MQKRGQFFLVAAFVIIILIVELSAIYISSLSSREDTRVYDLTNEIQFEASQVINNGVLHGSTSEEINDDLKELAAFYAKTNPDSDIAIYFGDSSSVHAVIYEALDCVEYVPEPPGFSPTLEVVTKEGVTITKATGVAVGDVIELKDPSEIIIPVDNFYKGLNEKSPSDSETQVFLRVLKLNENILTIELQVGAISFFEEIQEFEKKRVANYEIAIGSLADQLNIKIDIVSTESLEEAKSAIIVVPLPEGIFFSPSDIDQTRICFDFTFAAEPAVDTSLIEGRKISEGAAEINDQGSDKKISIQIAGATKEFILKPGQNFFVVIKKERDGERVISSN